MKTTVECYYDHSPQDEWERVDKHPMEFQTTLRAMNEFIPPNSRILDIGGGPGRYTVELAKAGHRVTLLDLSSGNIDLARVKADEAGVQVNEFVHGNALDLSRFADDAFDVVLLMGPLYHLIAPSDRHRSLREAVRVLVPEGKIFASFITRYAVYFHMLRNDPGLIGQYGDNYRGLMETGVYVPTQTNPGFTDAYFSHPMEIEPLMSGYDLTTLRLAAAEGLIAAAEPKVNTLPQDLFDAWVGVCYRLGTDPITWGCAEHMLYVGRKNRINC
jgi:ubiquinone/menaquinone biosynthesis C-methylase UbiE